MASGECPQNSNGAKFIKRARESNLFAPKHEKSERQKRQIKCDNAKNKCQKEENTMKNNDCHHDQSNSSTVSSGNIFL